MRYPSECGPVQPICSPDGHYAEFGGPCGVLPQVTSVIARHGIGALRPAPAGFERAKRVASQGHRSREEPRAKRMLRGLQRKKRIQLGLAAVPVRAFVVSVVGLFGALVFNAFAVPVPALAYATIEGPPQFSDAPGLPDGRLYEQVSMRIRMATRRVIYVCTDNDRKGSTR